MWWRWLLTNMFWFKNMCAISGAQLGLWQTGGRARIVGFMQRKGPLSNLRSCVVVWLSADDVRVLRGDRGMRVSIIGVGTLCHGAEGRAVH